MQRKLNKKRTNIVGYVKERDAIIEGINAGLADVKMGRVYTQEQVMIHIAQKFKPGKRRTIVDFVEELSSSNIDPEIDLKDLYYQQKANKYGFGGDL